MATKNITVKFKVEDHRALKHFCFNDLDDTPMTEAIRDITLATVRSNYIPYVIHLPKQVYLFMESQDYHLDKDIFDFLNGWLDSFSDTEHAETARKLQKTLAYEKDLLKVDKITECPSMNCNKVKKNATK